MRVKKFLKKCICMCSCVVILSITLFDSSVSAKSAKLSTQKFGTYNRDNVKKKLKKIGVEEDVFEQLSEEELYYAVNAESDEIQANTNYYRIKSDDSNYAMKRTVDNNDCMEMLNDEEVEQLLDELSDESSASTNLFARATSSVQTGVGSDSYVKVTTIVTPISSTKRIYNVSSTWRWIKQPKNMRKDIVGIVLDGALLNCATTSVKPTGYYILGYTDVRYRSGAQSNIVTKGTEQFTLKEITTGGHEAYGWGDLSPKNKTFQKYGDDVIRSYTSINSFHFSMQATTNNKNITKFNVTPDYRHQQKYTEITPSFTVSKTGVNACVSIKQSDHYVNQAANGTMTYIIK